MEDKFFKVYEKKKKLIQTLGKKQYFNRKMICSHFNIFLFHWFQFVTLCYLTLGLVL